MAGSLSWSAGIDGEIGGPESTPGFVTRVSMIKDWPKIRINNGYVTTL